MTQTTPTPPFHWQGRVDSEEVGPSTRWHQQVRAFDAAHSHSGVALVGFASDEGVRRNQGRPGAAEGPRALRQALAGLPVLGEPALWDAGDVACTDGALESAQTALAQRIAQVSAAGCFPLVLGGGHEVAWGSFQGLIQAHPQAQRVLILNLDAHFDLRTAAQGNSGTPFRQIHDWCQAHSLPFIYRVLGISRFANTEALFDRADQMGVRYWLDEALQSTAQLQAALDALQADVLAADAVYLTICLDVLPGGQAPGVSAPAPLGMPLHLVETVVDWVFAQRKVLLADVAELNPSHDRDNLTAKIAARLVARMARMARRG